MCFAINVNPTFCQCCTIKVHWCIWGIVAVHMPHAIIITNIGRVTHGPASQISFICVPTSATKFLPATVLVDFHYATRWVLSWLKAKRKSWWKKITIEKILLVHLLILFLMLNSMQIMNHSCLSTFMAAGHVVTSPHDCSGSITILSTMCWLWISTFSNSWLNTTDYLSTDTPLAPFAPATINLQIGDQNRPNHSTIHVHLFLKYF